MAHLNQALQAATILKTLSALLVNIASACFFALLIKGDIKYLTSNVLFGTISLYVAIKYSLKAEILRL